MRTSSVRIGPLRKTRILENIDKQAPLDRHVGYLMGQAKVHNLGKHIDHHVYKLYGLTEEEIKIAEQSNR